MDCCSLDPAASEAAPSAARSVSAWKRASPLITAVGVALLPKCPACWSVYAGLSSVLGVSFVMPPALLMPLTLGSLALALAALAFMAKRTGRYLPLGLGSASALGVYAGKFVLNSEALTWLALVGLVVASIGVRGPRSARGGSRLEPARSELPEHAQAR